MKLRQIATAIMLFYAAASFAAESPLEQAEENSDALVSDEIESAEASDSATAAAMTEPSDEEASPGPFCAHRADLSGSRRVVPGRHINASLRAVEQTQKD